ncbi:hypothetical protein O5O45_05730 [Hahella aquimaris]|uniref:glycine cleavage system protein H n=1 Tax=Hahella sp. HNIBRBA332 TaxID=3015983 RepID=UPI00273A96F6|nr:hypothetical protein [Hahella sp. HNIBRBA332]WLQ15418.1 hypothetical protein O5O45_05730 [Hahella sp. HNIBRBA332]
MNKVTDTLRYYSCHEWVRVLANYAIVGVTDFVTDGAITLIGSVNYERLYAAGDQIGVVETHSGEKFPFYVPVTGYITGINNHPTKDTRNPYGKGWLLIVKIEIPAEVEKLLTEKEYAGLIQGVPYHYVKAS